MKKILYILLFFSCSLFGQHQTMLLVSQQQFANEVGGGLINKNVRFIVADSAALTAEDLVVQSLLTTNVTTVQTTDAVGMDAITNHDFTVISESINSSDVASLKPETKPIMTLEGSNWDEFNFAISGSSDDTITTVNIINAHPITTGVSSPFSFNLSGAAQPQGRMSSFSGSTARIGENASSGNNFLIMAYDTGDTLENSSLAADKRVFIAGYTPSQWSSDTQLIFINTLKWFSGITP